MKFEQIAIKNFRNFENIEICISNKNIFFGLNDIGKTNFLYALRYVFDKDIRKNGFLDSDFHRKNVASPIEITVVIDISDTADPDSQKLRAQLKGALFSHQNKVYIKLTAQYDAQELVAMPLMYWGGNLEHLYEIKQRGYRYDIDFIFTVTYIDSYVDLYSLFKKNISSLIKHGTASDDTALKHIQSSIDALNANIANLPSVKDFEQKITPEYQKFRSEDISIAIKSLQIALSQILFAENKYHYLFVTTHSPFVLYDMDGVSLIRIFHGSAIDSASCFYQVPSDFEKSRKMLNRYLAEAIFANRVLLVEGTSELLLFEKVLSAVKPFYEADGIYILSVEGVGFSKYCEVLSALKIGWLVKTDNDLRFSPTKQTYDAYGFQRCNKLIGKDLLPIESYKDNRVETKATLYAKHKETLDSIRTDYGIYLSKVDLENDLNEILHNKLCEYLSESNPVAYLQEAKHFRMVDLIKLLTNDDCMKIFDDYNFACLKEITK